MKAVRQLPGAWLVFIFCIIHITESQAQKSVLDLFKSDRLLADRYYTKGELQDAIRLYERSGKSGHASLMVARGYFQLKEYRKSIDAYDEYRTAESKLSSADYLNYAEAQMVLKNYEKARENYKKILEGEPANPWITKKLWRISNMRYLYEDSIHFAMRFLSINTTDAEWGGVPVKDGILFLSNRSAGSLVNNVDAATLQSFYKIYHAMQKSDTVPGGWSRPFAEPDLYSKAPSVTGNAAAFTFYDHDSKMVFSASSNHRGSSGMRSLGIYFAELQDGKWKVIRAFDHNSSSWSMTDPAISEDGKTLYFASDKVGGIGGMDIYRSEWVNNKWTPPTNLGEGINTPMDEVFPYVHNGMMYFSSAGLPGMGGLDIYKIAINGLLTDEPVNLGYPTNSTYDDFSMRFTNNQANHGFLSSNRKRGGLDDDIYEFDMDMQTYPFTITGMLKEMDHSWSASSQVSIMPNARIILMDNIRNIVVQETTSNAKGIFSVSIPYFSEYGIRIVDADGVENIASFEIPRQRHSTAMHEIVLIKDIFQTVNKY